jgi:hypothetical protein
MKQVIKLKHYDKLYRNIYDLKGDCLFQRVGWQLFLLDDCPLDRLSLDDKKQKPWYSKAAGIRALVIWF